MPKIIGIFTRDDASDFKVVEGSDVKIRGTKDLTGITIADTDLLLIDDVSVSSGDADGTEDSTGRITASQLKTYIDAGTVTSVGTNTGLSGTVTSSGNLSLALGDIADMTQSWDNAADEFIVLDAGTQKRKLSSEIFGSNAFNSTAFTTNLGTVTSIATGDGLTGGTITDSGTISADLKSNGGVVIESATLAIDLGASSITGTLAVGDGGTGATDLTGVLFGNSTSAISAVALSSNGNIIVGGSTPAAVTGANLAGAGLAATVGNGTLVLAVETLNQDTTGTAAIATTVTLTDNEDADEENPIWFSAGAAGSGNIGAEADGTLTYNPSTGTLTATTLVGAHGNADSAVQPADTFYIGTTSIAHNRGSGALTLVGLTLTTPDIGTPSAGILTNCTFPTLNQNTSGTAAIATTVTISDNESTDEENAILFSAGADADGGNLGIEQDHSGMTYNPSTGGITATLFTGNVTGDVSGSAATVTGSSQAITALTGGDLTIYEDANNADVSLKMGTSATEALSIEVLNGASNKTAEEIKIMTKTDSETENHGKISVYIDEVEIFDIDDGGIDMAPGKTVAINGTDITGGGASSLSDLSDWSSSNEPVNSGNYQTLMPNIGDFHHDEDSGNIWMRHETEKVKKISTSTSDFTPEEPDPPSCISCQFYTASTGGSSISSYLLVGTTDVAYAKATYANVSSGVDSGTPRARFRNTWVGTSYTNKNLDGSNNTRTTSGFTIGESGNAGSDQNQRDSYSRLLFDDNGATEGGEEIAGSPSDSVYWRNNKRYGARDSGDSWATALSSGGNGVVAGGLNSSSDYSNISGSGTVTFTLGDGDQAFFAVPSGTPDITSIKVQGNTTEQIGAFSTTTATYTNSASYQDTYKIWYTTQQQAPGSSTWIVS